MDYVTIHVQWGNFRDIDEMWSIALEGQKYKKLTMCVRFVCIQWVCFENKITTL